MARRGWRAIDLARAAKISTGTTTAVMCGKHVSPRTLHKIVRALAAAPVIVGMDDLLESGDE
jgi:hypothetical protein